MNESNETGAPLVSEGVPGAVSKKRGKWKRSSSSQSLVTGGGGGGGGGDFAQDALREELQHQNVLKDDISFLDAEGLSWQCVSCGEICC